MTGSPRCHVCHMPIDQCECLWRRGYAPKADLLPAIAETRATGQYGAEAVLILGMIAGSERSLYLTDKDRTFIVDMRQKAQSMGSTFVATARQVYWLRDIKDRLVEHGEI